MVQPSRGEIINDKKIRRLLALSVGLFLFTIYLFVYRGGFHSIDEVSIFAVTESLVKFGRLNTDQIAWTQWTTTQAEAQGFFGQDGHVYSKKGFALSLAQAPLYWLALNLPHLGMLQTVSLLNAFTTAATALLIFMFVWRLDFSSFTAVMVALIYGLATIAFIYAKYLFSEPLAGFLLLLAAYMLLAYRREGGLRHVAIAGFAAGLAVVTRANNLFLLPIFGLYLLWLITTSANQAGNGSTLRGSSPALHASQPIPFATLAGQWGRPLATFIIALAIPGAVLLGYNALRAGNPLQTGYDLTLFSPNLFLGLYKLLFSPLRGLFIYSPILLLSLPGWWLFRKIYPAEGWLFAGLVGVTLGLFSAWSSGEGLSWGSRFLVPIIPLLTIVLAPLVEQVAGGKVTGSRAARNTQYATRITHHASRITHHASRITHHALRYTLYTLIALSCLIQFLGVTINPWVFLAQIQAEFGGEFFLENTAALYDFRYSQILGQLQSWSVQNSDLIWWQPWGFDVLAFGLSLGLVLLSGWLLWHYATADRRPPTAESRQESHAREVRSAPSRLDSLPSLYARTPAPWLLPLAIAVTAAATFYLLARYATADRQFGPPNDSYIQALNTAVAQATANDQIFTVAQYHYHLPMNRFKANFPITGFARQTWPLPATALPLLKNAVSGQNTWLITIGFPPAAPANATEQWLAANAFKATDQWLDDVRLIRYGNLPPTKTRPVDINLGEEVTLVEVKLIDTLQSGQTLPVEFVWLPLVQPDTDYNLFLQLLNQAGQLVAQHDGQPNGGYAPTSTWQPGRQILDRHALTLPPDLPPADYRLIAGLYNPTTGRRLAVNTGNDFVELGPITLTVQTNETFQ